MRWMRHTYGLLGGNVLADGLVEGAQQGGVGDAARRRREELRQRLLVLPQHVLDEAHLRTARHGERARLPRAASARRTYLLVEVKVDLAQVVAHLDHGQGLAAPLEEQVRLDRHARERRRVSMPRTLVARARARERYLELVELLDELVSGRGVLDELVGELEHLLEVAAEVQHEGARATHTRTHTRNGAADAISSSPRRGPRRWRAGDTAGRSEPGP